MHQPANDFQEYHELAANYYRQGCSCAAAILQTSVQMNLLEPSQADYLSRVTEGFRGGIGESQCVCGSLVGATLVIGEVFAGSATTTSAVRHATEFIQGASFVLLDSVKDEWKMTCCRGLTKKYKEFGSDERKEFCAQLVGSVAVHLGEIVSHVRDLQARDAHSHPHPVVPETTTAVE
jgi:C_GCAxxG_C_C family probable redox protein